MPELLLGPVLRHVGETDATVWVETDAACVVEVLGARERTWEVAGHHYALVLVEGLAPGSVTPYDVRLDGATAWPLGERPSSIRTHDGGATVRLAFGSCRYVNQSETRDDRHFGVDSLVAYARELARADTSWPDAVLMLGDQVYADETSAATRARISARRDITLGSKDQVADFEEYTWLYRESWTDPDVRWLLSCVPSAMIFDDHDVRDDWNTSGLWRREMQATDWWHERIVGGLSSYWVYQHLGNLTPADLRDNELYQQLRASGVDNAPALRAFAEHADAEADGAKGTRWSFRRDIGRTRVVMVDSRCGRILADDRRSMLSEDEFAWLAAQVEGSYDHLVLGTSLPWLLPRALHDLEAWDEVLCTGARGARLARFGEWLRRAADLEHWAAFHDSFDRLAALLRGVGSRPDAPASISVVSGDVHHAYLSRADLGPGVRSAVYQLTCSPLNNYVPPAMKIGFSVFWSRLTERFLRLLLGIVAPVPRSSLTWRRVSGPHYGNELAELTMQGRTARTRLRRATDDGALQNVASVDLS